MAARDLFYDAVKNALCKEDWIITHDPMPIKVGGVEMEIDLGAEKVIAAEKNGEKIAVEIKSFVRPSAIYEFHTAVGQYMNYRRALGKKESGRILYLAVPTEIYNSFFTLPFIRESLEDYQLNLVIYDAEKEVIAKWIKQTSIGVSLKK